MVDEVRVAETILRLVSEMGPGKSIGPGEAARALAGDAAAGRQAPALPSASPRDIGEEQDWQRLLGPVRRVAQRLAREGRLEILRKGRPVPPEEMRGVIRLRLRPQDGIGPGDAGDRGREGEKS